MAATQPTSVVVNTASAPVSSVNKVASVGLLFWLIKMMSTTAGETGADFLIFKLHWGLVLTSAVMLVPMLVILSAQLHARRYREWLYWLAVVMVSIVGTLLTDLLTDHWHVPLALSSLVFSGLLGLVFWRWYGLEQTLSITTINTRQRELFYWAVVLTAFALGTAVGDGLSEAMGLGYKLSGYIFAALMLIPLLGYKLGLNKVLCFWLAYILTRPLGASLGDWLSHSHKHGGLGFGVVHTSQLFLLLIVLAVVYLTFSSNSKNIQSSHTNRD